MKKTSRIGALLHRLFKIRWWIDYDRIRVFFIEFKRTLKILFIPKKPILNNKKPSTALFNAALKKFNMTEDEAEQKGQAMHQASLIMLGIAVLILLYALFHLVSGHYKASFLSLIIMGIPLVLAFRYHFWYYQIKSRTLGTSFKDWYQHGLMGKQDE